MKTTIDVGGRIVVPKRMRDFLGLVAGAEVEIELDGSGTGLRVAAITASTELEEVDGVLVANTPATDVVVTAEDLRQILEATRGRRL